MKKSKIFSLFAVIILAVSINAQELSVGSDFVSRYVWRGADFGNTFSIQPGIGFSASGFEVGAWGSYPLTTTSNGSEELDLYASYSAELGNSGSLSVLVTDYFFPNNGLKIGNYDDPGAHTIEAGLSYGGPDSFPISLSAYMNVYNDDDNTVYFEAGYSTALQDVACDFFVGGTPGGDAGYYGTTEFNLINVGLTLSKDIKITEDFSLPVFGSYILNPNTEVSFLVFGVSL